MTETGPQQQMAHKGVKEFMHSLSDLLVKQTITKRTRSQSIDAPDRLIVPLYSGERSAGTSYAVAAPKL